MADDEYSIPGDVVEGVGGRTYSGGTFSGILPHPWPKRRPSTYSTTSRSSQVNKQIRQRLVKEDTSREDALGFNETRSEINQM